MEEIKIKALNWYDVIKIIHIDYESLHSVYYMESIDECKLIFTVLVLCSENDGTVEISKDELDKISDTHFSNIGTYPFNDFFTTINMGNNKYRFKYKYTDRKYEETDINIKDPSEIGLYYVLRYSCGKRCQECNKIFKPTSNRQKYCKEHLRRIVADTCTCIDCGIEFEKGEGRRKRNRCDNCNSEYKRNYFRNKKREYRKELIYGN